MESIMVSTETANKDPNYTEMGMGPASQPCSTSEADYSCNNDLPTIAALKLNSDRKPEKVFCYILDDTDTEELPKRSYSVGSRPVSRTSFTQRKLSEESAKPTALIRRYHQEEFNYVCQLKQSIKASDTSDFVEMDFFRPRAVSESSGSRLCTFHIRKQLSQGYRPRTSSFGQPAAVRHLRSEISQSAKDKHSNTRLKGKKNDSRSKTKYEERCQANVSEAMVSNKNSVYKNIKVATEERKVVAGKSSNENCKENANKNKSFATELKTVTDKNDNEDSEDTGLTNENTKDIDKTTVKYVTRVDLDNLIVQDDGYYLLDFTYRDEKATTSES